MDAIYLAGAATKHAFDSDLAAAFDNPATYPDLTVICSSGAVHVHKLIVCQQSAWFATAIASGVKEGRSDRITLQDDEPEVRAMLQYCYSLNYDTSPLVDPNGNEPPRLYATTSLRFHIKMFAMAEFYQVRGLAQLATKNFESAIQEVMNERDLAPLAGAIRLAYETTTDQKGLLRKVIKDLMVANRERLFDGTEVAFTQLLEEVPSFAVGVALALARDNGGRDSAASRTSRIGSRRGRLHCPRCNTDFEVGEQGRSALQTLGCTNCGFRQMRQDWRAHDSDD